MNNRQYERKTLALSVNVFCNGVVTACKVLDISVGGAKIITEKPFEKGTAVELRFENFGNFKSRIMWRDKDYHGLKFFDDPAYIAEALAALALYG